MTFIVASRLFAGPVPESLVRVLILTRWSGFAFVSSFFGKVHLVVYGGPWINAGSAREVGSIKPSFGVQLPQALARRSFLHCLCT